ncbi:hypothetical protein K7X08_026428 [Anisodus acutangulus]|uniref:Remorin C-terminal domain-containing protein n=1 Tax=Anisodus acutangulus TaxID=402998 RepID=A0A9Q1R4N6_9SOLA|nr:hypothetical protein K7X08_026428 [Anisodus acutangulus]
MFLVFSDKILQLNDFVHISEANNKLTVSCFFSLDTALAQLNTDKKSAFIKAWEEAQKKLSKVAAWKNSKKAHLDAKLKKLEERLEQKKAEYAEKMKNKAALIHKEAEEKKAMVEAKRGEQILKTEEMAAKYHATGQTPKKLFGCVG